jgi:vacuolar-type H+-ATPase subunit F/Vma7
MITGFRLVGVEGKEVNSVDEAAQTLEEALKRNDLAVIIISQAYSAQPKLSEEINRVRRERRTPLVVEISGSTGEPSETNLSDAVNKILGFKL